MGLELHLDASKIEGLADGNAVSIWADESGNNRDVTQAEEAKQPTYKTGVLNGKPVVRFAGAEFLRATGFTLTQPYTIFVVARVTALGSSDLLLASGGGATVNFYSGSTWVLEAGAALTGSAEDEEWHRLVGLYDGTGSAIRLDASVDAEGNVGTNDLEGVTIGATKGGGALLGGDIAEVRVYDTALSTAEIEAVEAELQEQWFEEGEKEEATVAPSATATASAPASSVATGKASPTDQGRHGLPLPHPSVLANPARLGPPRFTATERRALGVD